MLRAMTNPKIIKKYTLNQMLSLAKESWDAIQASLAERKKGDLTELKALARTVLDFFSDDVQWIAIDANGEVWAYDLKPTIDETRSNWDNSDDDGVAWEIGAVEPPADYRNEIYEISKLIDND